MDISTAAPTPYSAPGPSRTRPLSGQLKINSGPQTKEKVFAMETQNESSPLCLTSLPAVTLPAAGLPQDILGSKTKRQIYLSNFCSIGVGAQGPVAASGPSHFPRELTSFPSLPRGRV